MLENLFTNVFGKPKSKSTGRNSQHDSSGTSSAGSHMTGPFSASTPQMPQPPNSLYPASPYPGPNSGQPQNSMHNNYPSLLPFSQPPSLPSGFASSQPYSYPTGTLASPSSPLESVPFELTLSLTSSTNLVSLDQLFKDIKNAADVVDRADTYLRSNQSDYDFKTELGLISH